MPRAVAQECTLWKAVALPRAVAQEAVAQEAEDGVEPAVGFAGEE